MTIALIYFIGLFLTSAIFGYTGKLRNEKEYIVNATLILTWPLVLMAFIALFVGVLISKAKFK